MVFIKDQWRANHPGAHPEIETYERLREHNIDCVATCLGGGDVVSPSTGEVQRTLTHEDLPDDIDNSERFHTRLILKQVGRPLELYANTPDLITITLQALLGVFAILCR